MVIVMKQRQRERLMFVKIKERRFGEIKSENGATQGGN